MTAGREECDARCTWCAACARHPCAAGKGRVNPPCV